MKIHIEIGAVSLDPGVDIGRSPVSAEFLRTLDVSLKSALRHESAAVPEAEWISSTETATAVAIEIAHAILAKVSP